MSGFFAEPKKAVKQAANKAAYLSIVTDVHQGRIDEGEGDRRMRVLGVPDRSNPFTNRGAPGIGGVLHAVAKPLGLSASETRKQSARIQAEWKRTHPGEKMTIANAPETLRAGGTVTAVPGATSLIGQALTGFAAQQVNAPGGGVQLVTHPLRTLGAEGHHLGRVVHDPAHNIPDLLLGGSLLAAGIGGTAARGIAARAAMKEGLGTRAAITRSSAEGGGVLHAPEPGTQKLFVVGDRPTTVPGVQRAAVAPHVSRGQEWTGSLPDLAREPGYLYHRAPASKFDRIRQEGLATAKPKGKNPRGVYFGNEPLQAQGLSWQSRDSVYLRVRPDGVPGLEERAFGESLSRNPVPASDLEYLGADGTWHPVSPKAEPVGGIAEGPRPAGVVERPLSRNVAARQVQKARNTYLQKRLYEEAQAGKGGPLTESFSAQTTYGREARAAGRFTLAKRDALRVQQQDALKHLSHDEHAAVSVAAIAGDEAILDPAAAIERQITTHQHFGNMADPEGLNAARVRELKTAQHALEEPSDRLLKALALTKALSERGEKELIKHGLLDAATAQGRKDAMAHIYGYDSAPQGSFYFPQSSRYVNEAPGSIPSAYAPNPGQYGRGPVASSQFVTGLGKKFTGESVAQGLIPTRVAHAIGDRDARIGRLLAARQQYGELWKRGANTKQTEFDIPIRSQKDIDPQLKRFFRDVQDNIAPTEEATLGLSEAEMESLRRLLQPEEELLNARPGAHVPGVRWVDSRTLPHVGPAMGAGGKILKTSDAVTNLIRTLDIYATPAYSLNLLGNLGMAGISGGMRTFPALKRAVTAERLDGAENVAIIDSGLGVSRSRSYSIPRGQLHQTTERLGEFWNKYTDMHVRRAAFYTEAMRAGYRTPEQINRLLHSPRLESKLNEVFRRANKNVVDYHLTPFEGNYIRRIIYFYPWISRGTLWAMRTLVENPGKSFTLAQLGQVGAENAHKKLPDQPSWAADLGLIPVGGGQDALQKVLNPSSVWSPGTMVQAGRAGIETAKGVIGLRNDPRAALGSMLTPSLSFAAGQAGAEPTPGHTGILGMIWSTPQAQAFRRAGVAPGVFGEPSKTYPDTGPLAAVGPYGLHGFWLRNISKESLRTQRVKELPKGERAGARASDEATKTIDGIVANGGKITAQGRAGIRRIYEVDGMRQAAYSELPAGASKLDRLEADLNVGVKLGKLTQKQADDTIAANQDASDKDIETARRGIAEQWFYRNELSALRKAAEQQKASAAR